MKLGRLFGIEVTVHYSWIFIFALVTWSLAGDLGPLRSVKADTPLRAVLAVVTALLFFASVLAHELAHSLVARARGIPIRGITLFIFGGVSSLEGEPENAPSEARIAGVGPLTSLLIALLFFALASGLGVAKPLGAAAGFLAAANFMLAAFNVLPAYPLDGGRVMHALVWRFTGDRARATRITSAIGRVLAWAIIGLGIVQTVAGGLGGGLWLTFIGWFLLQAGAAEALQASLTQALQGRIVSDLASLPQRSLAADTTADVALRTMLETGSRALPIEVGGRFIGLLTMRDFTKLDGQAPESAYVTALMTRPEDLVTVHPTTDAVEALNLLAKSGFHQLPVVGDDGILVGFVTREDVVRSMANRPQPTTASRGLAE